MKIKGLIGCDEDKEFVVYELDNGIYATVSKRGKVSFSAEWLHHAKWVPFDSSGNAPDDLIKETKGILVGYRLNEAEKEQIKEFKELLKSDRYKNLQEWQEEHREACRKRNCALMV